MFHRMHLGRAEASMQTIEFPENYYWSEHPCSALETLETWHTQDKPPKNAAVRLEDLHKLLHFEEVMAAQQLICMQAGADHQCTPGLFQLPSSCLCSRTASACQTKVFDSSGGCSAHRKCVL